MYVFQSWIESLRLFLPKNVRLLTLVTFRAYYLALKNIYTHFLGIGIGIAGILIGVDVWQVYNMPSALSWYIDASVLCIRIFLIFSLFLTVRPSIALKNKAYYFSYSWYCIYVYLLVLVNFLIFWLLYSAVPYLAPWIFYPLTIGRTVASSLVIPTLVISPLLVCIVLFILDSDGGLASVYKALIRGITMFVYNYPFCLITFVLFHGYACLVTHIYAKSIALLAAFNIQSFYSLLAIISVHQLLFLIFLLLGGLLPLVWITNFYIKRVHEQYTLYQ